LSGMRACDSRADGPQPGELLRALRHDAVRHVRCLRRAQERVLHLLSHVWRGGDGAPGRNDDIAETMSATTSPMFGHYRLGPLLGRGGMATVYVGEDTRHGRRVAIKVL